jgi:hypothetical protein
MSAVMMPNVCSYSESRPGWSYIWNKYLLASGKKLAQLLNAFK